MGEENKNIEDIFKDKLGGFSPSAPDGLWDKISAQMDAATPPPPPPAAPVLKAPWYKTWRMEILLLLLSFAGFIGIIYQINAESVIENRKPIGSNKINNENLAATNNLKESKTEKAEASILPSTLKEEKIEKQINQTSLDEGK